MQPIIKTLTSVRSFAGRNRFCGMAFLLAFLAYAATPALGAQNQSQGNVEAIQVEPLPLAATDVSLGDASRTAAGAASRTELAPAWRALASRLAKDGISGPEAMALLEQLSPEPTQSPMGRKIKELYQKQFFPSKKPATSTEEYYKGVVTEANARLCREFIAENEPYFSQAQQKYGVSPAVASALLFVETRLGKILADVPENAFYTLASMAVSDKPEDISKYLPSLPGYKKHLSWLKETMKKRSDWAYNETRALMEHMLRDHISPDNLPSSIYGAVGLCQFMPSNISVYGADGDGDGRVDLFNVPDAIASLANYLAKHGWKPGLSAEQRHKVLMSYNHSRVYANTILALAALVDGQPLASPPSPQKTTKGKAK